MAHFIRSCDVRSLFFTAVTRLELYHVILGHVSATIVAVGKKAIIITYSGCVHVAFGIQYAVLTRHIVFCGLPDSTIFSHIISKTVRFWKKSYCI